MKGFTLIETLIAISILAIAIAGPLYTASRALVAAELSRDELTASYLAQEGVEYVRTLRDNAYLTAYHSPTQDTTGAWADFVSTLTTTYSCISPAGKCQYDPLPSPTISSCPNGSCAKLTLSGGEYRLSGGTATPFVREITATSLTNEEVIVSKVTWDFHGQHTVEITDHLTPWQ